MTVRQTTNYVFPEIVEGAEEAAERLGLPMTYVRKKLALSQSHPRESRLFANEVLQGAPRPRRAPGSEAAAQGHGEAARRAAVPLTQARRTAGRQLRVPARDARAAGL